MKIKWLSHFATISIFPLLFLAAGIGLCLHHPKETSAPPPTASAPLQQAYWEAQIQAVGGTVAYQEFADAISDLSPQQQHAEAHIFGAALYGSEGLPGLTVCDSRFSFGCFHEFLGRAIASLGLSVVDELNQKCQLAVSSSPLSCQHGIGHGVLAYLGYKSADLVKALSICKSLPYNDPIGGCYGGVFMEYNLQTMLGTDGRVRPATSDLQAPCDEEPDVYATACYFWQPQWWRQHLRTQGVMDNDVAYAKIGALCAQAPSKFMRSCFEGIGNNIPPDADFDGDTARQLCIDATSDPTDQLYCRSLAADSLFVGGAGKKGDSMELCEGLTGASYQYCSAYATNKANIAVPIMTSAEVSGVQ